jgi:hypothetical protein
LNLAPKSFFLDFRIPVVLPFKWVVASTGATENL